MAESESQKRAINKWNKANKKRHRLYSDKSAAKRYIKNTVNKKGLKQLLNLIKQRLEEL